MSLYNFGAKEISLMKLYHVTCHYVEMLSWQHF